MGTLSDRDKPITGADYKSQVRIWAVGNLRYGSKASARDASLNHEAYGEHSVIYKRGQTLRYVTTAD
jgi:hypothetical protein